MLPQRASHQGMPAFRQSVMPKNNCDFAASDILYKRVKTQDRYS
jgi:hypothetical protein